VHKAYVREIRRGGGNGGETQPGGGELQSSSDFLGRTKEGKGTNKKSQFGIERGWVEEMAGRKLPNRPSNYVRPAGEKGGL